MKKFKILLVLTCMLQWVEGKSQESTFVPDTICGDWVIDPLPDQDEFSYFSCRKRGNGYEVYLSNVPSARYSGLFDEKNVSWLAIIDGILFKITWRTEDDHLVVSRFDNSEKVFEMKRVLNEKE
jgi:hypothetical protein